MIIKDDIISARWYTFQGSEQPRTVQVTHSGGVTGVPEDEDNTDYQTVLEWVADGNTIADEE